MEVLLKVAHELIIRMEVLLLFILILVALLHPAALYFLDDFRPDASDRLTFEQLIRNKKLIEWHRLLLLFEILVALHDVE